jgi:prepilin-type N-terminal cleavage/methylation domain-containing protein
MDDHCRRGFTLIELLIVVCIIGILMSILLPVLNAARERARKVQVASLVQECDLACNNFRLENGQYPWTKPPAVVAATVILAEDVYAELRAGPTATINLSQDYLGEVKSRYLRTVANKTRIIDIWQEELLFRVNPNGLVPVIWSKGKNKVDETNDGDPVAYWTDMDSKTGKVPPTDPTKFPNTYYWYGKPGASDDITNL